MTTVSLTGKPLPEKAAPRPTHLQGLPVKGYGPQSGDAVALVNTNKELEEVTLRRIEELGAEGADSRWLGVARTHIEQGFMAMNRAVFRPGRVALPGDE